MDGCRLLSVFRLHSGVFRFELKGILHAPFSVASIKISLCHVVLCQEVAEFKSGLQTYKTLNERKKNKKSMIGLKSHLF